MKPYKDKFYERRHRKTSHAAETILSIVLEAIPRITSAVDVGCGVGTWLCVLQEKGITEIQGLDGPWVDKQLLVIPPEKFSVVNLDEGITLDKRFDLAISLEVAEHLRPENASALVAALCELSDVVLFSAAIPFQGGKNHLNEQWPSYWCNLFKKQRYVPLDLIRKKIWDDADIQPYYRQNTLLYVKEERAAALGIDSESDRVLPLSLVHPDTYLKRMKKATSVRGSWKLFRRALVTSLTAKWKSKRV